MDRKYIVITFFLNLFLRRLRVAIFADIIKIVTMFIKIMLKDSRKVSKIRNCLSKWNLSVFLDIRKFTDFW